MPTSKSLSQQQGACKKDFALFDAQQMPKIQALAI